MKSSHIFICLILLLGQFSSLSAQVFSKQVAGNYSYSDDGKNGKSTVGFYSDKPSVVAENGMVSSAHPLASQIGIDILKKGGNAVDAAVAVFFALAVVHPSAGNIAGGGFMLFRDFAGNTTSLDFREKAPLAASTDMYLDSSGNIIPNKSTDGIFAVGVPGSVDGMVTAHEKYGNLSWEELLLPAILLAENGHALTEKEAKGLNQTRADFIQLNPTNSYYRQSKPWKAGDIFIQKDLAASLRRIQKNKRAGFYSGETARLLLQTMQTQQGIISQQDLEDYHSVWRKPIQGKYRNYSVISMAPPSSGGIGLIQLLNMVEPYPLARWGCNSDSSTMVMIEAERRVYADRSTYPGDPDFIRVPVDTLISKTYCARRMKDFSFAHATSSDSILAGYIPNYESDQTTHFSIVDSTGNAVAITTTLNGSFGSKVCVDGAGFLLNNEMDDFSSKAGAPNAYGLTGSQANRIEPGKRMLSSMTPTFVEQDGKLLLVLGTPGGSTIITSVFQTLINAVDYGMTMQQSVNALKFHQQWKPEATRFEKGAFSKQTLRFLKQHGQKMEQLSGTIGRMDCIRVLPDGKLEGGADPRSDNTAIGF